MSFYAVFYSVQNAFHYHIKDQSYCKLILGRLVSLPSDLLHRTLHNVRPVSNVLLLPLYIGSTVLRHLFSCPRLAFYCWALSAIMILKTQNECFFSNIQQFRYLPESLLEWKNCVFVHCFAGVFNYFGCHLVVLSSIFKNQFN